MWNVTVQVHEAWLVCGWTGSNQRQILTVGNVEREPRSAVRAGANMGGSPLWKLDGKHLGEIWLVVELGLKFFRRKRGDVTTERCSWQALPITRWGRYECCGQDSTDKEVRAINYITSTLP